jgi:hypothetical protein
MMNMDPLVIDSGSDTDRFAALRLDVFWRGCSGPCPELLQTAVGAREDSSMKLKTFYLLLCVAGTILPYWFLVQFLREHGLNLRLLIDQLFANPISSFFGVDVIVSAICLWLFIFVEGRRARVKNLWAPILASLLVGVSLGLPLFLYLRESSGGGRH